MRNCSRRCLEKETDDVNVVGDVCDLDGRITYSAGTTCAMRMTQGEAATWSSSFPKAPLEFEALSRR